MLTDQSIVESVEEKNLKIEDEESDDGREEDRTVITSSGAINCSNKLKLYVAIQNIDRDDI